jgi:hypothetical protein
MKHEYHEGLEAKERFDKLATRFFRAPKPIVKPATKPVRKPKKTKCYVACAVYTAIMLNETPFEFSARANRLLKAACPSKDDSQFFSSCMA